MHLSHSLPLGAVQRTARQEWNVVVLSLLLAADAAFILLHVFNRTRALPDPLHYLTTDGGFAEAFQYIKEYWIAILLLGMAWRARQAVYAAWGLLFGYLLCDDALQLHERVGEVVSTHWHYAPTLGLRAQDLGELTISATAGSMLLALIAWTHLRADERTRAASRDLLALFALLVFFGVFVDVLHVLLQRLSIQGFAVIEDGGEMFVMSLFAAHVLHLHARAEHVSGALWQLVVDALPRRPVQAWARITRQAQPRYRAE